MRRELGERRTITYSPEVVSDVIGEVGDELRAACIWGTAERLREEIGKLCVRHRSIPGSAPPVCSIAH